MTTRKPAFIGALLAGLALALNGCTGGNVTAEEIVAQSFDTSTSPSVVVETFNGHIEVTASAEAKVLAEATKRSAGFSQAEAKDDLKNGENPDVLITAETSNGNIDIRKGE
ncbi:MAG TPA: hypothetical protein VJ793_10145 [Anaerolineae bacterium]|nr:hypothetical protein [Anaerolineae bacterium]